MVGNLKLDKPELIKMIKALQKAGKISQKQADQTISELSNYSQEQVDGIKQQAVFKLKNGMIEIPDMKDVKDVKDKTKKIPALTNSTDPKSNAANKKDPIGTVSKEDQVDVNEVLNYLNN